MNLKKSQTSSSPLDCDERTFYIVFCSGAPFFLSTLLKEGFTHCYLIEKLEFIWIVQDPTRHGLNIIIPPCSAQDPLIKNMLKNDKKITVLEVITKGDSNFSIWRAKLLTCVSAVMYGMGVWINMAMTPYQLYKKLLKMNNTNLLSVKELKR